MRSARDTTHVNSICNFAAPLSLWPERVVVCRVLLSSVSSGCAKLLLVESGFPDLCFVKISLGLARYFNEHVRPSLLMFLVAQILFSCTNNLAL